MNIEQLKAAVNVFFIAVLLGAIAANISVVPIVVLLSSAIVAALLAVHTKDSIKEILKNGK